MLGTAADFWENEPTDGVEAPALLPLVRPV
jgi:hypothetical protein